MPQIQNGQGLDIAVPPGQSIAISSISGTYSASLLYGTQDTLATNSDGGATFGPYASGNTVRLTAGSSSVIAYEVGSSPSAQSALVPTYATDSAGNVTGLVGPDGGTLLKFKSPLRSLVLIGDSITAQGMPNNGITSTIGKYSNHGWWVHALAILGWPLAVQNMAAVSGRTSAQILAGFDAEVTPYAPDWVWGIVGQNNLGDADQGEQCVNDLRALAAKCQSIGARLMLGTVTPRASGSMTSGIKAAIVRVNSGIRAMQSEGLCFVFDSCAALTDPASADGAATAGTLIDTVHPNAVGAANIGRVAASTIERFIAKMDAAVIGNQDSRLTLASSVQLVANPKLSGTGGTVGTGGSGSSAASWSLNRQTGSALTVAGSKVNETGPKYRSWQRMTFGGTVVSGTEIVRFQQSVTLSSLAAALPANSIIKARVTAKQGATPLSANLQYVRLFVECLDSVPATVGSTQGMADSGYQCPFFLPAEGVIETAPLLIPAGTVTLRVTVNAAFVAGACSGDLDVTDLELLIID